MNTVEINIEREKHRLLADISEEKIRQASQLILNTLSINDKELSLYFCDNERMQYLNKTYRGKDYATDVLSFESGEDEFLGDIAISVEKADEQKDEFDSPSLDYEILRLLIHGVLHLLGYDHEKGKEEASIMKQKENEILLEVEKSTLYQK